MDRLKKVVKFLSSDSAVIYLILASLGLTLILTLTGSIGRSSSELKKPNQATEKIVVRNLLKNNHFHLNPSRNK